MIDTVLFDMGGTLEDIWVDDESRTYFLDRMQEKLNERMLRDEELERMRK